MGGSNNRALALCCDCFICPIEDGKCSAATAEVSICGRAVAPCVVKLFHSGPLSQDQPGLFRVYLGPCDDKHQRSKACCSAISMTVTMINQCVKPFF